MSLTVLSYPTQLTVMPSLEILDISRNKLKRLPSQPGSLVNLRVRPLFTPSPFQLIL